MLSWLYAAPIENRVEEVYEVLPIEPARHEAQVSELCRRTIDEAFKLIREAHVLRVTLLGAHAHCTMH